MTLPGRTALLIGGILAAMALAARLERDAQAAPQGLLTFASRQAAHPDGAYLVPNA